jgi:hypothetical protein
MRDTWSKGSRIKPYETHKISWLRRLKYGVYAWTGAVLLSLLLFPHDFHRASIVGLAAFLLVVGGIGWNSSAPPKR